MINVHPANVRREKDVDDTWLHERHEQECVMPSYCLSLLNIYFHPLAVTGEFRRIHTLDGCDTIAIRSRMRNEHGVLKNVCAFW